jgi:hypothetical protein
MLPFLLPSKLHHIPIQGRARQSLPSWNLEWFEDGKITFENGGRLSVKISESLSTNEYSVTKKMMDRGIGETLPVFNSTPQTQFVDRK